VNKMAVETIKAAMGVIVIFISLVLMVNMDNK
jgi:hypothetical protein